MGPVRPLYRRGLGLRCAETLQHRSRERASAGNCICAIKCRACSTLKLVPCMITVVSPALGLAASLMHWLKAEASCACSSARPAAPARRRPGRPAPFSEATRLGGSLCQQQGLARSRGQAARGDLESSRAAGPRYRLLPPSLTGLLGSRTGCQPLTAGYAGYPLWDPVHRQDCIRDALRLRHTVHTNLRRGSVKRHEITLPDGLASVDHCQHVAAEVDLSAGTAALVFRHLVSGAVQRRVPLPHPVNLADAGYWSWGAHALAVPHGLQATPSDAPTHPGLLMLDLNSGAWVDHPVAPCQRSAPDLDFAFISDWSATGLLLAEHASSTAALASVFNAQRELVGTLTRPEADGEPAQIFSSSWAPNGCLCHLFVPGGPDLWLWEVGAPLMHSSLAGGSTVGHVSWAPDSKHLLIVDDTWSPSGQVLIWSSQCQVVQAVQSGSRDWIWGSGDRLATLQAVNEDDTKLQMYSISAAPSCTLLQSNEPSLGGNVDTDPGLALSPDASCFLAVTLEQARMSSCAVVSLTGGVLQTCQLPFSVSTLQWADNGAAVLVSDYEGREHVMLDFACPSAGT